MVHNQPMADPQVPYAEDEEVPFTTVDAAAWRISRSLSGLSIEGPCPACGHPVTARMDQDVTVKSVAAGATEDDRNRITRFVHCDCRQGHPGRPAKITRGCGRRWAATAQRDAAGWQLIPATRPEVVDAARVLDAAMIDTPEARKIARSWLPGITALYGLLGLAGVASGHNAVQGLSTTGRVAVLLMLAVGLALASFAVWSGYTAAYGWVTKATLADDEKLLKWAEKRTTETALAPARLATAVGCSVASVIALLVAVGISWLS